jgi:hypothetical protein
MWLYLRSFDIFKKIEPKTQDILVPGTALSYEDSRGFIPLDKFHFSKSQAPEESDHEGSMWILACPQNKAIAERLGYGHLLLEVDPAQRIVRQVKYTDLAGRLFKTYRLIGKTELDERSFPREVELRHFSEGFRTTIQYEYWLPGEPPPASLFTPDVRTRKFIERLKMYVAEAGLGDRIESELKLADEQLQEFVDRLSRMKGGKAATSGIHLRESNKPLLDEQGQSESSE